MLTDSAVQGYEALRLGAAWHDLSSRGRLRASGDDRVRLIHAISSNAVEGLTPGQGTYAFFLDPRGRIQADSHIWVTRNHVLIDCEPEVAGALLDHIESYIIMDDVSLDDITHRTSAIAVAGPASGDIVRGLGFQALPKPACFTRSADTWVFGAAAEELGGYWLMVPESERGRIVAHLETQGATEATDPEWEAHRVMRWVPRFGVDFGPTNIPHEARQFNAISFSKGCYTGQEIVERVRSRGRVRRRLVGVELATAEVPDDLTVRHEGRPCGTLTSPTPGLPPAGLARGFAILRGAAGRPGSDVQVGGATGTVRDVSRS